MRQSRGRNAGWRIHLSPQVTADGRQRVDERWLTLGVPRRLARGEVVGGELVSEEQDEAEGAEEAGCRPVDRAGAPVALRRSRRGGPALPRR